MCKDHFTAGRESEIVHTDAQYTRRSPVSEHTAQLGSFIYSAEREVAIDAPVPHSAVSQHKAPGDAERQ